MGEAAAGVRLRQGHAWIARLAQLDGWSTQRRHEADRMLDVCPPAELDRVVEDFRSAMWDAMERTGNVPHFERTAPQSANPVPTQRQRKPRGLARHLYRERAEPEPTPNARDPVASQSPTLVPPAAVSREPNSPEPRIGIRRERADEDPDPHRVRCCESCAHWRRHPESGAGLCMAEPSTVEVMAARRAWLAAGNALCRCEDFFRSRVQS